MLEILNDQLELSAIEKVEDMCQLPEMISSTHCGDCYKIVRE